MGVHVQADKLTFQAKYKSSNYSAARRSALGADLGQGVCLYPPTEEGVLRKGNFALLYLVKESQCLFPSQVFLPLHAQISDA